MVLPHCVLQAYSPLGRGIQDMGQDPVVLNILPANTAKIPDRWLSGIGIRHYFPHHLTRTNQDIFFFALDETGMDQLSQLARPDRSWGLPSPYDMT